MKLSNRIISRRQFFERSAQGISSLALGHAAVAASTAGTGPSSANPFAYDVSRFATTDPQLLRYHEVSRIGGLHPEPHRVAIGPEDRLYIAHRNGVDVFDGSGKPQRTVKIAEPARCVAVAGDGTLYVGLKSRIEVFESQGQHVAGWEIPGSKSWLTGLAVGESDLLAADSGNRVVFRFDRTGKLTGRIGEKNKERQIAGLIVPSPYLDVALGRDGLVRVNNPGRHCVEMYTLAGDLELSWGKPSAAIAGFCGCCNPIGLAMLPDGSCVTCEKGLPRVKVYSPERTFDCVVAGPESFAENAKAHDLSDCSVGGLDAAVDSRGRVYVLDLITNDIRIMARKA